MRHRCLLAGRTGRRLLLHPRQSCLTTTGSRQQHRPWHPASATLVATTAPSRLDRLPAAPVNRYGLAAIMQCSSQKQTLAASSVSSCSSSCPIRFSASASCDSRSRILLLACSPSCLWRSCSCFNSSSCSQNQQTLHLHYTYSINTAYKPDARFRD